MTGKNYEEKFILTETEQKSINVLKHQTSTLKEIDKRLKEVNAPTDKYITQTEQILKNLGISLPTNESFKKEKANFSQSSKKLNLRTWDEILIEAEQVSSGDADFSDLFTSEEIQSIEDQIGLHRSEFKNIHRLDKLDWAICGVAGFLAALVDVFLVQMPKHPGMLGNKDHKGGPLSNFIRNRIQGSMTPEQINQLEKNNWVPYDASHSRKVNHPESRYKWTRHYGNEYF